MRFNVYIDESGDAGILKVRSKHQAGTTPYFAMGALVCKPTAEIHVRNALSDFKFEIGKTSWKHATDLSHAERVYFARNLNRLPVRYFGLLSNKATLAEYKTEIEGNSHKFYNKCAQLLLENVLDYLRPHLVSDDDVNIVFESRNHDFDAMRRFLGRIKETLKHHRSKIFRLLNPFAISVRKKGEEDLLEVADFVAHAVFQAANRSCHNFEIPETRYLREISSCFAGDAKGSLVDVGLKCVHNIDDLNLDPDVQREIRAYRVRAPQNIR